MKIFTDEFETLIAKAIVYGIAIAGMLLIIGLVGMVSL